MPNRLIHDPVAVVAGVTYAAARAASQPDYMRTLEAVGGGIGGVFGGRLPDILEPAHTPCHRGSAHSLTAAATVLGIANDRLDTWQGTLRDKATHFAEMSAKSPPGSAAALANWLLSVICRVLAGCLAGFAAGYTSHLALDAMTPASVCVI